MTAEMTTSLIRPGRLSDAAACAAILNEWIDQTKWMPRVHSHRDVEHHYRSAVLAARSVFVSEQDGTVTGFIARDGSDMITALYLAPDARGQGAGTRLLNAAKEGRKQLNLWTFVINRDARRFYMREGFAEMRRTIGENEEGLPDILYEWRA
ncbi:N-acetyltransferase family protein [Aestuariibius insulae]|uniref:GNAT family N-acetyltransferase n=1 Tax=Aestuariibius insulae TaxID=2058287 RepID=UPI00347F072B